jgi:hypothetical protein
MADRRPVREIVAGVVITKGVESGGGLKRDWVSGGRDERGAREVMELVCVWRVPSFW